MLLSKDMIENDKVGIESNDGDCKNKTVKRSFWSKNPNRSAGYLNFSTKLAFTQLRKAFIKISILQYFDLEYYIWTEIDALGYTINRALSQLTLDNLDQWNLIAYYLQKMITFKIDIKLMKVNF